MQNAKVYNILASFSVLPNYLFCSIIFYMENSKTITSLWFQLGDTYQTISSQCSFVKVSDLMKVIVGFTKPRKDKQK